MGPIELELEETSVFLNKIYRDYMSFIKISHGYPTLGDIPKFIAVEVAKHILNYVFLFESKNGIAFYYKDGVENIQLTKYLGDQVKRLEKVSYE